MFRRGSICFRNLQGHPRERNMKPEMIEGSQAQRNFESGMKTAFSMSKAEITKAEKKDKAKRKRKKR
jgi:hypothetical protein